MWLALIAVVLCPRVVCHLKLCQRCMNVNDDSDGWNELQWWFLIWLYWWQRWCTPTTGRLSRHSSPASRRRCRHRHSLSIARNQLWIIPFSWSDQSRLAALIAVDHSNVREGKEWWRCVGYEVVSGGRPRHESRLAVVSTLCLSQYPMSTLKY